MFRFAVIMIPLVALLAGCGTDGNDAAVDADAAIAMSGRDAYEQACARCHEDGLDGAPRTGDREAWANRSQLWEAVLFEHAQQGYLGMPARGGAEAFDDTTIKRAAEHMLTLTYPERNPD